MPQQFLWVDGAEGQHEGCVQTARQRQSLIRSHAQRRRTAPIARPVHGNDSVGGRSAGLHSPGSAEGALARSSRPSRSLGRLAGKPIRSRTGKRKEPEDIRSFSPNNGRTSNVRVALPKTLQSLWHDFSASERTSLSFFECRTSREWSGWEDSQFWSVLALQVSQQSQSVARSLIALSAFHEQTDAVDSIERARLQNLSQEQSGKATRALLARSEISYFEALVSCLVMACFHGLQHSQGSFVLLRSGLQLLAECDIPGRASCEERQLVDLQIRPLFERLLSRPSGMVDMCRSFALSVERQRAKSTSGTTEMPRVPQISNTLSEARDNLQEIMNWAHDNHPFPADNALSMQTFLTRLHELKDVWQTSLAGSDFPKTTSSVRSQRLLAAACLVGTIVIDTAHCIEETVFDGYQAEFEEILSLVEGTWSSGHSFGIDAGLFDISAFVGTKCRDPHIRRRALRLLKSGHRLEGDRTAANPATILETLIALEERDLQVATSDDVPERNRRRLVRGQQYVAQGTIELFYTSSDETFKERCYVSLAGSSVRRLSKASSQEAEIPDAIFGTGYAAYLENRETMDYFRIKLERFYFPIPRV
jgi:hypothetical protein